MVYLDNVTKLIWRTNQYHMSYIHNIMIVNSYLNESDLIFVNEDITLLGIIHLKRRQLIIDIACSLYRCSFAILPIIEKQGLLHK